MIFDRLRVFYFHNHFALTIQYLDVNGYERFVD